MAGNIDVTAGQPVRPAPERADVERALDGVLASEMFRGSAKLGAFLRYVVEATLRGEQDRIKGYTIGVEALGREPGLRSADRPDRAGRGDAAAANARPVLCRAGRERPHRVRIVARQLRAGDPYARR